MTIFFVLENEFESNKNNISVVEMVEKFLDASNKIDKSIKAFIPSKLKKPIFCYPFYIKKSY